jgi:hypothetical protein
MIFAVEEPTITESKKGAAGLEFNKEHAHCFSKLRGFITVNCFLLTLVNSDFYCDISRQLRENVRRKRPELWRNHNWLLHHDNSPTHTTLKTTEFVTNDNTVIVPHASYSPDLAPVISFCFQN